MNIAINKAHYPVSTLGFGRRVGIWTQGCSIRCPECVSKDTWDYDDQRVTTVEQLTSALSPWLTAADGVTISGGEPFDQPKALFELLGALRKFNGGDILVFSGYSWEFLFAKHREIVGLIDVLVTDPYRPDAGAVLTLRGSDNQRIFILTDLARSRYPANLGQQPWGAHRRLDFFVESDTVWLAGIPRTGEMVQLNQELNRRGISCKTSDQLQPIIRA